mgnify:CR=1 FL=1
MNSIFKSINKTLTSIVKPKKTATRKIYPIQSKSKSLSKSKTVKKSPSKSKSKSLSKSPSKSKSKTLSKSPSDSKIADYIYRSASWSGENQKTNKDKALAIIKSPDFNPNQKSKKGVHLFHLAYNSGQRDIIKLFIENPKTNTDVKDASETTVLQKAIAARDDVVIGYFKKNKKIPTALKQLV